MKRADFNKLKNTEFKDEKLSKFASWAIWDKKEKKDKNGDYDPKFIEKNVADLNGKIVFVGLNFGKKVETWVDWQNFYNVERLINLLSGTRFEGAYMTDIIKNHHDSDSAKLMSDIKEKKIKIDEDIDFFFEELNLLKAKDIEMYLFGGAVEKLFKKYVIQNEGFRQKVIKCQRIHHYSRRVQNFEEIAYAQLDIKPRKKSTVKAKIYEPIWEN
jgi:hypothetical protein